MARYSMIRKSENRVSEKIMLGWYIASVAPLGYCGGNAAGSAV
jgi:hypothetical protein